MNDVGFGIVGTGLIAGAMADALQRAEGAALRAVGSRKRERAEAFTQKRPGVAAVEGVNALCARDDVQVVYVATPTAARTAAVEAALGTDKHVLIEKPMPSAREFAAWRSEAHTRNRVLLDATHFVHHPRTDGVRTAMAERMGRVHALHTSFHFPSADPANIRLQPDAEPWGAWGDMGWYAMRAVVEYLRPNGGLELCTARAERHPETNAIIRVDGLVGFEGGETSTFSVGYTAGALMMGFELLGSEAVLQMDDFVLDVRDSLVFRNPELETGFLLRSGMVPRAHGEWISTPSPKAAHVVMLERFAAWVRAGDSGSAVPWANAAEQTQSLVDAVAHKLNG